MENYLDSRLIALNSSDATLLNGTYKSWVMFPLNGLIIEEDNVLKIEISLVNAQIPVSFYTVNYTNNQLKIKLGSNAVQYLTIPVGNYNANTLIAAINTLILDSNFIVTISKINGKLSFSYNNSFIIYTDNVGSIGSILGFDLNASYASVLNALSAPYPLDLLGYKRLEIYSQNIQTTNYSSLNDGATTLLCIVPVDQPSWGLITYNNYTDSKNIIKNKTLNKIELLIKGEDENFINFNNIDWCIKLKIDITRKYINSLSTDIKNTHENHKLQIQESKSEDIIKNDLDLLNYSLKKISRLFI